MIKSGTSRERVAEILKASGVRARDMLVYLYLSDYLGHFVWTDWVESGFEPRHDYLYAVRLDKDGPRKIELVEPKTLDEKLFDVLWQCAPYGMHELRMRQASAECANVAEEHYKK